MRAAAQQKQQFEATVSELKSVIREQREQLRGIAVDNETLTRKTATLIDKIEAGRRSQGQLESRERQLSLEVETAHKTVQQLNNERADLQSSLEKLKDDLQTSNK